MSSTAPKTWQLILGALEFLALLTIVSYAILGAFA